MQTYHVLTRSDEETIIAFPVASCELIERTDAGLYRYAMTVEDWQQTAFEAALDNDRDVWSYTIEAE